MQLKMHYEMLVYIFGLRRWSIRDTLNFIGFPCVVYSTIYIGDLGHIGLVYRNLKWGLLVNIDPVNEIPGWKEPP